MCECVFVERGEVRGRVLVGEWHTGPGAYETPAGDRGPRFSLGSRPDGGGAVDMPGIGIFWSLRRVSGWDCDDFCRGVG